MYQAPPSVTESNYEVKRLEHEQADARYDRLHAGYDDAPRAPRKWWQFWHRGQPAKVTTAATRSTSAGPRPATDSRRVEDFRRAVDDWKGLDASAAERAAAYTALTERFSDLPPDLRQSITAEALRH